MMKALFLTCFLLAPALVYCQGQRVTMTLRPGPSNRRVTITSSECDMAAFCIRGPGPSENVTLSVRSRNGTATAPEDYSHIDRELTFAAGEVAELCIEMNPVCDNVTEGNEDFFIDVRSITPGAYSQYRIDITVIITEDGGSGGDTTTQPPTVSRPPPTQIPTIVPPPRPEITVYAYMEMSYYTTSEEAGQVEVCVILGSFDNRTSVVTLKTRPSSAMSPGDYQEVNEDLEFSSEGCNRQCINITIFREEREFYERSEYFFVLLSSSDPHVFVAGRYSVVEIQNARSSPRAKVTLERSMYEVSASEGEVEVCAVLSDNLGSFEWRFGSLQTIPARSSIVQARPSIDFELDSKQVYFGPRSQAGSKSCLTVSILQGPQTECGSLFQVRYINYGYNFNPAWPTHALIRITS